MWSINGKNGDTMRELLLDTFKLGLGAMDMTREEAEKLVKKVQKKYPGEIKDGRKMINDLVAQGKKSKKSFESCVKKEVNKTIKEQKLVDESDLRELAANVKELAKNTAKIGSQVGKNAAAVAKQAVKEHVAKKAAKSATKKTAKKKAVKKAAKKATKKGTVRAKKRVAKRR
jgi:polyhydroxyalkanoate synthesis regulator phasin